MSDARDLFEGDPASGARGPCGSARPGLAADVLHELGLMRLTLEAIRTDLAAIREEVDAWAWARPTGAARDWEDAPLPAAGAPLAAGGGASYPGFPASFRRTGGGR